MAKHTSATAIRENPPTLSACEWDFRRITESELLLATAYEYLRSHAQMCRKIGEWLSRPFDGVLEELVKHEKIEYRSKLERWSGLSVREALRDAHKGPDKLPRGSKHGEWALFEIFRRDMASCGGVSSHPLLEAVALGLWEFPKPWMEARDSIQEDGFPVRGITFTKPPAIWFGEPSYSDFVNFRAQGRNLALQRPWTEFAVVVDLYRSKEDITNEFSAFIESRIQSSNNIRKVGRGKKAELLKWLAAYRLARATRQYGDIERIIGTANQRNPLGAPLVELPRYIKKQKFCEAARKAKRLIAKRRPSFLDEIGREFL